MLLQFLLVIIIGSNLLNVNAYSFLSDWDELFAPEGLAPKLSGTVRTASASFPMLRIRGDNMLAINAVKNIEFTVSIRHLQLGSYSDSPTWQLRTQNNTLLDSGTLLFNQTDSISYQHDKTEVLYLYINTGRNCFYLTSSNANIGMISGVITKFLGNNSRKMYFEVPSNSRNFTITLYAGGTNEHVKVKIYNSSDTLITQGETNSSNPVVDIPVTVGEDDSAVWYLEINAPSSGTLEDYALKVSADIPPVLSAMAGDSFYYAPFGKNEAMSVLVDKVMAASTSYQHATWMIDAAQNAGFNTYVPRMFYGDSGSTGPDPTQFAELAGWCDARNMKTLAWMRGTHSAPFADSSFDGKRYRPGSSESAILSPNSDELWSYFTTAISQYAALSRTYPSIQGVFLDFEDYYTSSLAHAYYISYDDVITGKYETARSITVNASPENRKDWLISNNYHDDFVEFQVNYWNTKCAELRAAIDVINPQFRFFVYPFMASYSSPPLFIFGAEAPIIKLSSQQAPIVHAEISCYYDPYTIIHDADADMVHVNNDLNSDISSISHNAPYMMLAGFDPICLDNLEFVGRASILGAEKMQGYWVFYESFDYPSEEHTDCMSYFAWANARIAENDYDAAETGYTATLPWNILWDQETAPDAGCTFSNQSKSFSTCKIRGTVPLLISCQSGTSVSLNLNVYQLGNYSDPVAWELRSLDNMTRVDRGTVWIDEGNKTISFTPQVTGTYVLALSPRMNSMSIASANAPIAFYAGKRIDFLKNTTPLYLNIPSGTTSFSITVEAGLPSGGEGVKVSVYSPGGQLVEEAQTSSATPSLIMTIPVGSYGPGAWKIITGSNGIDYFEDFYLTVGNEIPRFISLSPDTLFNDL
jgi:hypothetical protein